MFDDLKGVVSYEEFVSQHIFSVICNQEEALYVIMYARFMAACHLKKNSFLFEDFLGGDVNGFC